MKLFVKPVIGAVLFIGMTACTEGVSEKYDTTVTCTDTLGKTYYRADNAEVHAWNVGLYVETVQPGGAIRRDVVTGDCVAINY